MADVAEPRRSQRERKQAQQFLSGKSRSAHAIGENSRPPLVSSSLLKRKRSDATSDEEHDNDGPLSEDSDHAPADDEGDAEEGDFHAPKPPGKSGTKRKPKAPTAPKKPRAPKGTAPKRAAAKPAGPPKPKKTAARKGKQPAGAEGEFDAEKVAKDSKIAADNALFSAWLSLCPKCCH